MVFISHPLSVHLEQQCTDVWGTDPGTPGIAQGPPPESWRGTEGRSILWDALLQPQERHQGELRRSTQSAFLYLNPSANLLMCTSHLDSLEPHHHCQCREKSPLLTPPIAIYLPFLFDFVFLGARQVWLPFPPVHFNSPLYQFQTSQLLIFWTQLRSLESQPSLIINFLASSPPAFTHGWCSVPEILPPKASGGLTFLVFLLLQAWQAPVLLLPQSICIFLTLLHIPFWFCPYILYLFQSDSFVWLFYVVDERL